MNIWMLRWRWTDSIARSRLDAGHDDREWIVIFESREQAVAAISGSILKSGFSAEISLDEKPVNQKELGRSAG